MMTVGFIGLGIMGSRMAHNILKGGHEVFIFNRTKEKANLLIEAGAIWCESAAELVKKVPIVITMLSHPEAVREVAVGKEGFLTHMDEGKLWMDSSTVNPSFTQEMAKYADRHQVRFIDAPVAGSREPAESGELIFLVGGAKEDVAEVEPLMELMGKKTIHMGERGKGSSMKILVNLMLAQSMVAFSETMALGKAMAIPEAMLLNVLLNIPVTAAYLANVRPKFESMNFEEANFPLRWMRKDLHMVATTAYEHELSIPSASTAEELFTRAIQEGLGDHDFSAIYGWIHQAYK